jgi:hypothetical protein
MTNIHKINFRKGVMGLAGCADIRQKAGMEVDCMDLQSEGAT